MEDIVSSDQNHVKKVCKDFEIKSLEEYQDLNLKKDRLLLANVSKNFRNMVLEIYELDPAKLL